MTLKTGMADRDYNSGQDKIWNINLKLPFAFSFSLFNPTNV
jgi:hypothetical protein